MVRFCVASQMRVAHVIRFNDGEDALVAHRNVVRRASGARERQTRETEKHTHLEARFQPNQATTNVPDVVFSLAAILIIF